MDPQMPATILVVDDEPILASIIAELLVVEGYATRTAANGEDALATHTANPVDLILSDIMMPVLDGLALVRLLRERGDPTPVVLMSAVSSWHNVPIGVPLVRKPFDIDKLLAMIGGVLSSTHRSHHDGHEP
jgi:two-component system, OmpR family, response regulator MprA